MKRYVKSTTFMDILNDKEGRKLVEMVEDAEYEIRGRGIDINDDSSIYVRQLQHGIKALKDKFGYEWQLIDL